MSTPGSLTTYQKNLCEYGGAFGVLLTLTCLVQHFAVVIPGRASNPLIPCYIFAITAFVLLGLQKHFCILLVIFSTALSAFMVWQWMKHYSFSLVVVMLFIYHIIIIVAAYADELPESLKRKRLADKAERDLWKDKI